MHPVIEKAATELHAHALAFDQRPLLIGGMAMEYYGMRKSGPDIDLVISDKDYQSLATAYPKNRKDIYGDLGVVLGPFEIWRSIALFDYDFLRKDAFDEGDLLVVSLDRLLLMRVSAMDVEKYRKDLVLMRNYYYERLRNPVFDREAQAHIEAYKRAGGIVLAGKYQDG